MKKLLLYGQFDNEFIYTSESYENPSEPGWPYRRWVAKSEDSVVSGDGTEKTYWRMVQILDDSGSGTTQEKQDYIMGYLYRGTASPINSESNSYARFYSPIYGAGAYADSSITSPTINPIDLTADDSSFELSFYARKDPDASTALGSVIARIGDVFIINTSGYLTLFDKTNVVFCYATGDYVNGVNNFLDTQTEWTKLTVVKDGLTWNTYINDVLSKSYDMTNEAEQRALLGTMNNVRLGRVRSLSNDNCSLSNFDEVKLAIDVPILKLYKTINNKVYGFDNGVFGVVANDWTALTDAEKQDVFANYGIGNPSSLNMASITDKFSVLILGDNNVPVVNMDAIPTPKIITQNELYDISAYEHLDAVTLTSNKSGNGEVKIAVTKDLSTYYVYDNTNNVWSSINLADIGTDGMTQQQLNSISESDWHTFSDGIDGIGFAYYIEMSDITDIAEIDNISIQLDGKGLWLSAIKGKDFEYRYSDNQTLKVTLKKSGDYKINYPN